MDQKQVVRKRIEDILAMKEACIDREIANSEFLSAALLRSQKEIAEFKKHIEELNDILEKGCFSDH